MSIEENKAIARRWNEEIWSKGNLAAIDELLASDFVFNYPSAGAAPDREGYKRTVAEFRGPCSDIQCSTEEVVAEGDKVVVRWTWSGTHTGEVWGVAATGERLTLTGISILRIAGDKIVEEWGEMDNLGLMGQLGLLPPSE
jgi:steroid delta-isomerase-like uncharacterized protein